jgi:hypothetical protein
MKEEVGWWMEYASQFVQTIDFERIYFSEAAVLSPRRRRKA